MEQYLSPVSELVHDHGLKRAVVVDGSVGQVLYDHKKVLVPKRDVYDVSGPNLNIYR